MATFTENFSLKKPESTDAVNIEDINNNMDIIDEELAEHNHDEIYHTKQEINAVLSQKVDKVTGKGLSTEDFTTFEKSKLAGIADYIIEQGIVDGWSYVKYKSGRCELHKIASATVDFSAKTGVSRCPSPISVNLPFTVYYCTAFFDCADLNAWASGGPQPQSTTYVSYLLWRAEAYMEFTYYTQIYVRGFWKDFI